VDDVLKEKDDLPGHAEHTEKAGAQLIRVPEHGGKIESISQIGECCVAGAIS
jgi:hypothetical protein